MDLVCATLKERFGKEFEDSIEALKNLTQTGRMRKYQEKFDRLLTWSNFST